MMSTDMAVVDVSSVVSLVQDTAAVVAFTTLIEDAEGAPVLHVDGSNSNQLVITIANQTSAEIIVSPLTGAPTSNNANITFSLPNSQFFFYTPPTIDASSSTPGIWALAMDSDGGWVDKIYLANSGTCTLGAKGSKNDTLTLTLNYGGAVPDDPKMVNILAQIEYQNMKTASGVPLQGLTSPQNLTLMADAGRPSPLVGSFVGPAAVFNDGKTPQNLTLRLVNTSQDPMQFLVPPTGQQTQSYIEVAFPVSDQTSDAVWALCGTAAWRLINNLSLSGFGATGWSVAKSTTTVGVLELRPDISKVQNIPPNGTLDLLLSNVTSALASGFVQVQVSLKCFALLGTQTFGVALEKTPLIYNTGNGTGMTLSAGVLGENNALNVTGDSSSAMVALTQSGSGPALGVSGNVSVTGNFNSAVMDLIQNGSGPTLTVSGSIEVNANSPNVALNVQGETNITTPSGTLPLMVRSDHSGGPAAEISIANLGGGAGTESTLSFKTYNASGPAPSAIVAHDDGNDSNHLYFQTKAPGNTSNPLQTRMTVASAGNVGINTTTPSQLLDVNGNANVSGTLSANIATLGTTTITGQASTVGPVSMMQLGQIQEIPVPNISEFANYSASTDGFLTGVVQCAQNDGLCLTLGVAYIYPRGGPIIASATNIPTLGAANSFTIPIPANTNFSVYCATWSPGVYLSSGDTLRLQWIPLGQGALNPVKTKTAELEALERTVTLHQNQAVSSVNPKQMTQAPAQQNFISTLERVLGKPLDDTDKQDLVSSIQGLLNS